jgi:acyl-CoA reductase-like NAD-dependent aldehyde dehydrogenase
MRVPRGVVVQWRRMETRLLIGGELAAGEGTRLRARTDELAELMSREGGKPRVENADEVSWTAAAFDYYAEIGRNSAGRERPAPRTPCPRLRAGRHARCGT